MLWYLFFKNNYVNFVYFLQLCVDYIYTLKLYFLNTTLIYKYNLLIIAENKQNLQKLFFLKISIITFSNNLVTSIFKKIFFDIVVNAKWILINKYELPAQ